MPSSKVTLSIIVHMLLAFGTSFVLNKLFSVDMAKTFMVYFVTLSWIYLTVVERYKEVNKSLTLAGQQLIKGLKDLAELKDIALSVPNNKENKSNE